jgi:hypothetical protein
MGRALPDLPLGLISGGVPSDWRRRLTRLVCVSLHAAHDKISPPAASAPPASAFSLTRSTIRHGPRRCSKWG